MNMYFFAKCWKRIPRRTNSMISDGYNCPQLNRPPTQWLVFREASLPFPASSSAEDTLAFTTPCSPNTSVFFQNLPFSSLDGSGEEWIAGQDFSRIARGLLASPAAARDLPLLKSTCSQQIRGRSKSDADEEIDSVQRPMRRLTWVLPKPKNGNRVKHHHGEHGKHGETPPWWRY